MTERFGSTRDLHGDSLCERVTGRTLADRLWKVGDVAEYLQVSTSWVYKQAEAGLLPTRRLGASLRFDPADIRAYGRGEWKPMSAAAMVVSSRRK